jgi:hypothetical protein
MLNPEGRGTPSFFPGVLAPTEVQTLKTDSPASPGLAGPYVEVGVTGRGLNFFGKVWPVGTHLFAS